MKYVAPSIINVHRATSMIQGGKNSMIQDSGTGGAHSVSPAYEADE
jgi:hypothetical protein